MRIVTVVLVLVATAARAAAQDAGGPPGASPPPVPPPPATFTVSYRTDVMLSDGISIALTPVVGIGLAGYLFGAPLIHALHHNPSSAWTSLGLRVVPLGLTVGTYLALRAQTGCNERQGDGCFAEGLGALVTGGVAAVAVMVIDWTRLAHVTIAAPRPTWTPTVALDPHRAVLGVIASW